MKINPAHIDKLYGARATDGVASVAREEPKRRTLDKDNLDLSDAARGHSDMDAAVNLVVKEATKPTSAEKLLSYKNDIQRGTYLVSGQDIAAAMLNWGTGRDDL